MSSLVDQFYLYNTNLNAGGNGVASWSAFLGGDSAPMTAEDKERFSHDLEALEAEAQLHPAPQSTVVGSEWSTFARNEQWRNRKNAHVEQLRSDLQAAEEHNCTFRPSIDAKSRRIAVRGEDIGARLHELHLQNLRSRSAQASEQERAEAAKLTFHPRLVRSDWTECVQPRYLDPQGAPRLGGATADDTCTFQPVINRDRSGDEAIARYLSMPVHERLVRRAQQRGSPQQQHGDDGRRKLSAEELAAFVERTRNAEAERRKKIARLARAEAEAHHTPCRATFAPLQNYKVEGTAASRNAALQTKIERRRVAEPLADTNCTFTPKINRIATQKTRAPGAIYKTNKVHEIELKREQEERRREAERECTFRPHLSPSARRAKGRIVPSLKSAETFDVFVKTQRGIRESDAKHWRTEAEERLHADCTFAPATGEVPAAVRAIASSLHAAASQQGSVSREGRAAQASFRF